MGEMDDIYGYLENGEYNPLDEDCDDPTAICLNCDRSFSSPVAQLYCSDLCSDIAALVRYVRRCQADGRIERSDVAETIEIRLAHILGGGYDRRGRKIPEPVRSRVKARDGGRCKLCGQPGTEIDHIDGSSNDLGNLRLLCRPCHVGKTKSSFRIVTPEDDAYEWIAAANNAIVARTEAATPLRDCDDADRWPHHWQLLLAERRTHWKVWRGLA